MTYISDDNNTYEVSRNTEIQNAEQENLVALQHESVEDLIKQNELIAEADNDFYLDIIDAKPSIEAILFASGEAIGLDKIASVLGYDKEKTRKILQEMITDSAKSAKSGLMIRALDDAYTICTKPEMNNVLKRLYLPRNRPPMTQAAYETLAIIAYNQPITRSQVEAVRGVSSDSIMARLIEKNLITECGTLDAPGRPTLFETTELFLKEFGLSSIRELPPMEMMMYGTLLDIESSLSNAAGSNVDNQITIDQIVETILPKSENAINDSCDSEEIMNIASAVFGEDTP